MTLTSPSFPLGTDCRSLEDARRDIRAKRLREAQQWREMARDYATEAKKCADAADRERLMLGVQQATEKADQIEAKWSEK